MTRKKIGHIPRGRLAMLAIALVAGLSGCRSGPGPTATAPPATAPPSPTPFPTATFTPTSTSTPTPTFTASPTATATPIPPVTFAVIGDYGTIGPPAEAVSELVHSWNPDFVITVGDNSYGPIIDDDIGLYYHRYIYPYVGRHGQGADRNRFWPALGNHDWDPGLDGYLAYFTLPGNERYYDVAVGPVHLFAVDADYREPDGIDANSIQAQWLQAALAASAACWQVVYMHLPPYSSGTFHGAFPIVRWPFAAWGADTVVAGHEHHYERLLVDGLPYFVNGLGGASIYGFGEPVPESQVRFNATHGAMRVTATATTINYEFFSIDGALVDSTSQTGGCPD